MERSTIIASVIAGAGILIAGSVAGTAAVNAAASSEPDPSNVQLLAAPAALDPSGLASTDSTTGAALPPFTTEPLPEIMVQPDALESAASASSTGAAPSTRAQRPSQPSSSVSALPSSPAASAAVVLPPEQAVALVLAATGSGSILDVRQVSRAGYDAWAVTVQRQDGSVVTGFVDRATATVFDWRVVQEAPRPAPVNAGYQDDDADEYESEHESEHESDEHESDEHEGDEDDD